MKKVALVFVLAVLLPSLVLAWLAVRSLRDQQFLLERQQSLIDQHVTDALAQNISDYLAQRQQEFAAQVETSRRRRRRPNVGGAIRRPTPPPLAAGRSRLLRHRFGQNPFAVAERAAGGADVPPGQQRIPRQPRAGGGLFERQQRQRRRWRKCRRKQRLEFLPWPGEPIFSRVQCGHCQFRHRCHRRNNSN